MVLSIASLFAIIHINVMHMQCLLSIVRVFDLSCLSFFSFKLCFLPIRPYVFLSIVSFSWFACNCIRYIGSQFYMAFYCCWCMIRARKWRIFRRKTESIVAHRIELILFSCSLSVVMPFCAKPFLFVQCSAQSQSEKKADHIVKQRQA